MSDLPPTSLNTTTTPHNPTSIHAPRNLKTVLIGIMTTPHPFETRQTLRMIYRNMSVPTADLVFVMGLPRTTKELQTLQRESAEYGDILILNCLENMNEGKTHAFFEAIGGMYPWGGWNVSYDVDTRSLPFNTPIDPLKLNAHIHSQLPSLRLRSDRYNTKIGSYQPLPLPKYPRSAPKGRRYEFALKADDDSFLHLPNLVRTLNDLPHRHGAYYGRMGNKGADKGTRMECTGAAYAVSWDLVDHISSPSTKTHLQILSAEDQTLSLWLRPLLPRLHGYDDTYGYQNHPHTIPTT
ncbi:hypothetical protein HK097_003805, partial [Rhizophlyctis rosea]